MPALTPEEWCLAAVAAMGVGVSKAGFSGFGLFHVVVFAFLFGARTSTGIVLPMLIVGDILAVRIYRQHARWDYVRRLLPPTIIGIVVGWGVMRYLDDAAFKPVIGGIILLLTLLQVARMWKPDWFGRMPHAHWFSWSLGLLAGFSTMLANAAGPIIALYLLTVALPKMELVGTTAWFFLILNVFKVPFSAEQGLIGPQTLALNGVLIPAIITGLYAGRWLIHKVPQRLFDGLILCFSFVAALRLLDILRW